MTNRDSLTMIEHLKAAERERCARIAQDSRPTRSQLTTECGGFERGFYHAAKQIADAIRADGEQKRED